MKKNESHFKNKLLFKPTRFIEVSHQNWHEIICFSLAFLPSTILFLGNSHDLHFSRCQTL
jgi:hypothetical protein